MSVCIDLHRHTCVRVCIRLVMNSVSGSVKHICLGGIFNNISGGVYTHVALLMFVWRVLSFLRSPLLCLKPSEGSH